MNNRELCEALITADSEEDVLKILEGRGLWDSQESWRPLGGSANNYGTVNNQSGDALGAFVELLINSSDAVLMRKCREAGIDPEDQQAAPQSIAEAVEEFFAIKSNQLSEMTDSDRTFLAENTCGIVVTGAKKRNPTYGIYDTGEGQAPQNFEKTFLSIGADNKIKTLFVQGKFCQGSHGVLGHCGDKNFKLIVSKSYTDEGNPEGEWGFTILRRRRPGPGERVSVAEYLVIQNKVPSFKADGLKVIPGKYPEPYGQPLNSGTFIKLYEYDIGPSLRSNAKQDFNYSLGSYLVSPALPIRIFERRKGYSGNSYEINFTGLAERLKADRNQPKIEEGFPISGQLNTSFGELRYSIYILTKNAKQSRYAQNHGVILTVNGQKHATHPRSWFETRQVELSTLSKSLICLIDCSSVTPDKHEDLFKSSRDRMEDSAKKQILSELAVILSTNQKIKDLKNKRREELIDGKTKENKLGEDLMISILQKNSSFREFLSSGGRIPSAFNTQNSSAEDKFVGVQHPTYFRLEKEFPKEGPKIAQLNQRARVQFRTDVEDGYLYRSNYPGRFTLACPDFDLSYHTNPYNGIWTANIQIPDGIPVGKIMELDFTLGDETLIEAFKGSFYLKIGAPTENDTTNSKGKRRKNKKTDSDGPSTGNDGQSIWPPRKVTKNEWSEYDMDEKSALVAKHIEGHDWVFYYNADNAFLKNEMKIRRRDASVLEQQFSLGLQFLALAYIAFEREKEPPDIVKVINEFTRGAAASILPIIDGLAGVDA